MYEYSLPDLDYPLDALEPHYDAEGLEIHHQKHHAGYVKNLNRVQADIAAARESGDFDHIPQLEKSLAFNLAGHRLHALLWNSLSPDGGGEPAEALGGRLAKDFGSVDAFRRQFAAAALSLQGSGWAVLALEPESGSLIVEQVYDHQNNSGSGTRPLLALDMWEHAFYLQYRNEKAKWVDAFWEIVNWKQVTDGLQP